MDQKFWGHGNGLFAFATTHSPKLANRNKAQPPLASEAKDMRQSLYAAGGVGDTVVKYDDRPRGEVLFNQPADVPNRRMHWVVGVCRA